MPAPPGQGRMHAGSAPAPSDVRQDLRTPRNNDPCFDDDLRSARGPSRVRGPAEARAARSGVSNDLNNSEDPLPPGAKGADFRTLQDMIAKGIQDAESGASSLEADISMNAEDAELLRHREQLRRRREEEAAARQHEKEAAREKRRREDEARLKRMAEEMEREERETCAQKEAAAAREVACRRQLEAAVTIQARIRGWRSRAGKPTDLPVTVATLHAEPWGCLQRAS